jgi:hypothetical protein
MMKSKKTNYKFWHSPIALIVLFCFVIFFGYKIVYLLNKQRETSSIKEDYLNKIDALNLKQNSLISDTKKLETEQGKEEIIRGKYPFVKDGEKMVIIIDEENNNIAPEKDTNNHGFWNWINKIFKK